MSAALVLLGPGAFSLDARLFGRREIIIPEGGRSPRRWFQGRFRTSLRLNATVVHTLGVLNPPSIVVSDAHQLPALKIPSFAGCNHPSLPS
jgi:hypothetical protein